MTFEFDTTNKTTAFVNLPCGATFTDRIAFDDDRVLMKISMDGYDCEIKPDDDIKDESYCGAAVDLEEGDVYLYKPEAKVVRVNCKVIVSYT